MSSLLSVTRQGRTQSVVKQARSTLHQLDSLRANSTPTVVDMTEAIAQLRAAATDIDDSVTVVIDADRACDGDEPPTYPSDAVRAIGAALAEALRNSILHAGAAEQSVTIAARPGSLRVSVVDDGVGFDQSAVPPHRLGVAVSIRGRLRQLSGGSSHIISSPGTGTTVQLAWHDGAVT